MATHERQMPSHIKSRAIPGIDYESAELGPAHDTSPDDVLTALTLPGRGVIYDLDAGRWPGMPVGGHNPPFTVTAYRTPLGVRASGDYQLSRNGSPERNFVTDMIISGTHTGTHLDALSHITRGEDDSWHGGYTAAESLGDFGPMRAESSSIPPFVCRGVLIDVANARGEDALPAGELITAAELDETLHRQNVVIRSGDAVLLRTGYMKVWGTPSAKAHAGAGIGRDGGRYLADQGAVLVGADTEAVEQAPATDLELPLTPVHIDLLIERGIYLLELAYLEDLSRDRVYEFLFMCLPLRIRGGTGAMVRPIAIA